MLRMLSLSLTSLGKNILQKSKKTKKKTKNKKETKTTTSNKLYCGLFGNTFQ